MLCDLWARSERVKGHRWGAWVGAKFILKLCICIQHVKYLEAYNISELILCILSLFSQIPCEYLLCARLCQALGTQVEKCELFPAFLVLIVPEVGIAFLGFSVDENIGSNGSGFISVHFWRLGPAPACLNVAPPNVLVVDTATQGVQKSVLPMIWKALLLIPQPPKFDCIPNSRTVLGMHYSLHKYCWVDKWTVKKEGTVKIQLYCIKALLNTAIYIKCLPFVPNQHLAW